MGRGTVAFTRTRWHDVLPPCPGAGRFAARPGIRETALPASSSVTLALIVVLPVILLAGLVVTLRSEPGATRIVAIVIIVSLLVILAIWGLFWLAAIWYNQQWSSG
jgi:hypothetical protein